MTLKKFNILPIIAIEFIILFTLLCVTLFDIKPNISVVNLVVTKDSLPTLYNVDDDIDLSNATVEVYYSNKSNEIVPITKQMITGFNTSITGSNKTMTITYKEKSVSYSYRVINPADASKEIITTARLNYYLPTSNIGTVYDLEFNIGDLTKVSAISLTLYDSNGLGLSAELDELIVNINKDGWNYEAKYVSSTKIRLLFYFGSGSDLLSSDSFARIFITDNTNISSVISDIIVTDGVNDYFLPNAKMIEE